MNYRIKLPNDSKDSREIRLFCYGVVPPAAGGTAGPPIIVAIGREVDQSAQPPAWIDFKGYANLKYYVTITPEIPHIPFHVLLRGDYTVR
jgi:hypothetical protein